MKKENLSDYLVQNIFKFDREILCCCNKDMILLIELKGNLLWIFGSNSFKIKIYNVYFF